MKNKKPIICENTNCAYWNQDICEVFKTNCAIHDSEELLENGCNDFMNEDYT